MSAARVFEPVQAPPDAAARTLAQRFADRELDVLCEQGNFERARLLLGRRAAAAEVAAEVYLDAVRTERSAAPAGAAWQAWAERALDAGAEVARALQALLPEPELCAWLVERDIGWSQLARQRDAASARELLRMRLQALLRDDAARALSAIEDSALVDAARNDDELRKLAIGVMAGAVWSRRDRVFALAPRYGVDPSTNGSATVSAEAELLDALSHAARMQPGWEAATRAATCPAPLERFVRCGRVLSRRGMQRLARELQADLRTRPHAYFTCLQALAHAPEGLSTWLNDALCDARDLLAVTALDDAMHAEAVLERARRELRGAAPQRAWYGALALAALVLIATAPWHGFVRPAIALLVFALAPLRLALDTMLYTRTLRPALLEAIAAQAEPLGELCKYVRTHRFTRGSALVLRAERDPALAIASAIGELGRAGSAQHATGEAPASARETAEIPGRSATEQVRS